MVGWVEIKKNGGRVLYWKNIDRNTGFCYFSNFSE